MFLPVELIGNSLVIVTADYQGIASEAIVIKEGKHINIHLQLILIIMDIVRNYGVRKCRVVRSQTSPLCKTFTVCMLVI